jgi:hypothetical protein
MESHVREPALFNLGVGSNRAAVILSVSRSETSRDDSLVAGIGDGVSTGEIRDFEMRSRWKRYDASEFREAIAWSVQAKTEQKHRQLPK